MTSESKRDEIVGVGYEGRGVDEVLGDLVQRGVRTLVDVRLTPLSRKRGFSKRALAEAAASVGIDYVHLRGLGNPKENRPGFAGDATALAAARANYRDLVTADTAAGDLARIAKLAAAGPVALLCFEADEQRCHRHVLLDLVGVRHR
ncbi:DUF488 family protein [Actinokineospora enzanensis]|uniref:DUF488 domain-containing protein n=1 Tax=Actinokineospora enzanensis TaxID=155975 RepID=UPI0004778142|nr:DUF488 domain-containing protein [Actinokineospora enzanensis]